MSDTKQVSDEVRAEACRMCSYASGFPGQAISADLVEAWASGGRGGVQNQEAFRFLNRSKAWTKSKDGLRYTLTAVGQAFAEFHRMGPA